MATPLTADQWIRILKAEGVKVSEYPGWRTRSRDSATGLAFGPVRMILNHHTAGRNSRDIVAKNGVPGLPAPLAHVHLAKSGVATMCSAGRANHAGPMAVNAYQAFRDELSAHPAPSRASGTIDGNDVSYGVETENLGDGEDVYPEAQYDAWVRINAAVCRHHGWSMDSVGCHKETSVEGKIDPRGPVAGYGSRGRFTFTPDQFRRDVNERLKHPASWSPGDAAQTPVTEDDMALSDDDARRPWKVDGAVPAARPPVANDDYADGNESWSAGYALQTAVEGIRKTQRALGGVEAKVDDLTDLVRQLLADKSQ